MVRHANSMRVDVPGKIFTGLVFNDELPFDYGTDDDEYDAGQDPEGVLAIMMARDTEVDKKTEKTEKTKKSDGDGAYATLQHRRLTSDFQASSKKSTEEAKRGEGGKATIATSCARRYSCALA